MVSVLLSLPTEVMLEVFKNMRWRDILHASQVCRTFFEIAQDRSIWITLLRDSPTLLYRPILEASTDMQWYTAQDLRNILFRNISSTLGWNSPRKPQERIIPYGGLPIGNRGKVVLLEGGRWLLTFGRNLSNYDPDYDRAILAYDLDSPEFTSTVIYKDAGPENNKVLKGIHAQVDHSQSCLAFMLGLVFADPDNPPSPIRFDVLRVEQRGRGPEAKLVTVSKIKSLGPCEDIYDMMGDYVMISYYNVGDLHPSAKFLNWRTSSSTRHAVSTLKFKFGARVHVLPKNKFLTIEDWNKINIYVIPELRWAWPLEVPPTDVNLQRPIWSASLSCQAPKYALIMSSKPSYGPFATRLAFTRDDRIYGLVIPHDGSTPTLHVLAITPALPDLMRSTEVTICIDKIYAKPMHCSLKASMVAFSWPEEAYLGPTAWVPPILQFTHKVLVGHDWSMRDLDLVDGVSGRLVVGLKYEDTEFENGSLGEWSVVDFCHPQFLPSLPSVTCIP